MESVILVDENDNAIGTMEKMEAHHRGILHRAFSILIFNSRGQMLVQKRARTKYHSGGLWTNACCSHPKPDETIEETTRKRLIHEMGIDVHTTFSYKFLYKANLDSNLIEHELDHVFIGVFDGEPNVNPEEVEDWKFVNLNDLRIDTQLHPERYTQWFRLILQHELINTMA